jgi:glycosyltransferase involved in cell wall biosynthesis
MDGIAIHRLKPMLQYGNAPVLPALFPQASNVDIIHLHMPFYGGAEMIALLRWFKPIPLVITHHQDVKLKGATAIISRILDSVVSKNLMCQADRACFTSLDYAHASQYAPLIANRKINADELPNGVDIHRFRPDDAAAQSLRQSLQLENQNVLLFVGVLDRAHYFKGIPNLLQALAQISQSDASLVVVGKGDMLTTYQQEAERLGIAQRVHFAGFVPDEALPDYYRMADVTILPSTTAGEAFGLVLVESLACGTPVIASALPGVRTVVADEQDGFLVQPGHIEDLTTRMKAILTMPPEQRHTMGMVGRKKVEERYAWERIGQKLEALYHEVLAEQRKTDF